MVALLKRFHDESKMQEHAFEETMPETDVPPEAAAALLEAAANVDDVDEELSAAPAAPPAVGNDDDNASEYDLTAEPEGEAIEEAPDDPEPPGSDMSMGGQTAGTNTAGTLPYGGFNRPPANVMSALISGPSPHGAFLKRGSTVAANMDVQSTLPAWKRKLAQERLQKNASQSAIVHASNVRRTQAAAKLAQLKARAQREVGRAAARAAVNATVEGNRQRAREVAHEMDQRVGRDVVQRMNEISHPNEEEVGICPKPNPKPDHVACPPLLTSLGLVACPFSLLLTSIGATRVADLSALSALQPSPCPPP